MARFSLCPSKQFLREVCSALLGRDGVEGKEAVGLTSKPLITPFLFELTGVSRGRLAIRATIRKQKT